MSIRKNIKKEQSDLLKRMLKKTEKHYEKNQKRDKLQRLEKEINKL